MIRALAGLLLLSGTACVGTALGDQGRPTVAAVSVAPTATASPPAPVLASPRTRPARPVVPVRLSIPAIGVSSALLRLGQTASGAVAVPPPGPSYDVAGWYGYSPVPGDDGPAVLVGHVDSRSHGPSVFYRLADLRPHDRISVRRSDGTSAVFAVASVRRYPKAAFPTSLVYGDTAGPTLRLITCGGSFDRAAGHYRDDVVVLATRL